ncbi:MAG TPA: glycosyltransferase [Acidimicrobiales bacterium]|nr:glycosyltransferase [Acidimicrobiales bacterium]
MRIALVSEHASPLATLGGVDAGGQNVHVAALAEALARQGADVVVYTRRDDPGAPARVAVSPGVAVEHVSAGPPHPVPKDELLPYMDEFARELVRRWTAQRPHVAHAHFWMSGKAAVAAGLLPAVPVVQTFHALGVVKRRHQGEADTSPPERVSVEADLVHQVQRVIATSSEEVFELARMGADPHRVSVVPCGVDLDRFRPDGRREPRVPGTRRVVVVGRLVERKGTADVVEALVRVPDAELVVAGGPPAAELGADPEARRLLSLARRAGVAERVSLRGRVGRDELPALLRSADAVACVPWYEPFGLVAVEAMACGVPVVASAVGGLCDTVVDGATGVHVPPRRPDALAAALNRLFDDDGLRRRLGQAGAQRARARYGWDHVARATMAVYREVTSPALAASMRGRR